MKHLILCLTFLATTPFLHAVAVVTNVRAAQIPGTHQVAITYDFTASSPCTVSIQVWINGASPLNVPATAFSGDIGNSVSPGTGKSITLTVARTDASGTTSLAPSLQNTFTKNLKFKVLATESSDPVNYGDMAQIPGGPFQMGDQSNPLVGYSDERPVHTVQVSTFYMGKYEVTKELWDEVWAWVIANGRGYDLAVGIGSSASKGANHPVLSMTWFDMVKWCNARSEKENLTPCYTVGGLTYKTGQNDAVVCNFAANGYRLPTEAEWEKAARGNLVGQNFPLGNTIGHSTANYYSSDYSYEDDPKNQGDHPDYDGVYPYTAPVNSFTPNGYGLYNMSGNVSEWCWDRFVRNYYSDPAAGTNPQGPNSGSYRVGRGGSWSISARSCRVALRMGSFPTNTSPHMGFRPARSSVP